VAVKTQSPSTSCGISQEGQSSLAQNMAPWFYGTEFQVGITTDQLSNVLYFSLRQ